MGSPRARRACRPQDGCRNHETLLVAADKCPGSSDTSFTQTFHVLLASRLRVSNELQFVHVPQKVSPEDPVQHWERRPTARPGRSSRGQTSAKSAAPPWLPALLCVWVPWGRCCWHGGEVCQRGGRIRPLKGPAGHVLRKEPFFPRPFSVLTRKVMSAFHRVMGTRDVQGPTDRSSASRSGDSQARPWPRHLRPSRLSFPDPRTYLELRGP